MTSPRAVTIIAEHLAAGGLPHPGDENTKPFTIPLPLRKTGLPPEMEAEFAAAAGIPTLNAPQLVGEAVVHLLESKGIALVEATDLEALKREAADAPDGVRVVAVHCRCDRAHRDPLLVLRVDKTDRVTIDGRALITGLGTRTPDCPHGERSD